MRIRHVKEIEWICRREPRHNADLFDAEEHEDSPKNVYELYGQEQNPERDRLLPSLGRETRPVVTNEHCPRSFSRCVFSAIADRVKVRGFISIP